MDGELPPALRAAAPVLTSYHIDLFDQFDQFDQLRQGLFGALGAERVVAMDNYGPLFERLHRGGCASAITGRNEYLIYVQVDRPDQFDQFDQFDQSDRRQMPERAPRLRAGPTGP